VIKIKLVVKRATLNAISTCKVALKYPICNVGGSLNEDQGLNAILACKIIHR